MSNYEDHLKKKAQEEKQRAFWKMTKKLIQIGLVILVVGGLAGLVIRGIVSESTITEEKIISREGLHWHSHLSIYVGNEAKEIPANIGLGIVHNPIHTHDADGVIHLEFSGLVREEDTRLKKFFDAWGKDIETAFGSLIKMTVNGEENEERGKYAMKDGDKIELFYE